MCLKWFQKPVNTSDILPEPKSSIVVDGGEVTNIIRARFPSCELFISDLNSYKLVSHEDLAWFLLQDQTNKGEYVVEKFDCDDYSYRLMGQVSVPNWSDLAFGIVWTDAHALNCFIDEDKKFWFVEPQDDTIRENYPAWAGKNVRFIIM